MRAEEQFRIARLQVFNWGTFSGIHDIPIASRGFLFVGRSGSGKTTLLDAFSALLVPPKWIDFNAAAREGERGGRSRDRSLVSYVRGAWAEQQDDSSGTIATQYLRTGTTWSGLALTYADGAGGTVVLAQLFWIRGKSNRRDDLRRLFLIFQRPFDLREFGDFRLDVRKLKQQFPEAFVREDFAPYGERFRRVLGIDNELALRLLHKTQSAKNLGDLNTFLREFMLDRPETFAAAERLVAEFADLNAAHAAVVTAREQIQTLAPAREDHRRLAEVRKQETGLDRLRASVDGFKETCLCALLENRVREIEVDFTANSAECDRLQADFDNQKAALGDLELRHRESGGGQIENLQKEKLELEATRDQRLRRRNDTQLDCGKAGWRFPETPQAFAEMTAAARRETEEFAEWQEQAHERYAALADALARAKMEFAEAMEEAESLRRQMSNVPARSLQLRARIAGEVGLPETELPFAAELLEVPDSEAAWRGAIERVLRGFALSLLVEERHYTAVSELVNRAPVGDRLVYHRVGRTDPPAMRPAQTNSLVRKVQIKPGPFAAFLESEIRQNFDYACVDSMQAFRGAERAALTRQGQWRRGKTRHEKDDRFELNDRSRWVLGFDNTQKRVLFEERAAAAAKKLTHCESRIRDFKEAERQKTERALLCQKLANVEWQEIDVAPLLDRLTAIGNSLRQLREGSTVLRELGRLMEAQRGRVKKAQDALIDVKGRIVALEREKAQRASALESLRERLKGVEVGKEEGRVLAGYFNQLQEKLKLDNADRLAHQVDRKLDAEQKELAATRNRLTNAIERRFADFNRRWPMDAGDLDTSLASAADYFAKLTRLETDRLPDYEHRFFELLRNQSHQNLAALATHITQARKMIFDRLEVVNQSLANAEFNTGTHLHIDAGDRNLEEVRNFRQEIQKALSHAWTEDRDQAESRFRVLRDLVERLASEDPDQKRWRNLVLDVRLHVEFLGRESDSENRQVEVYQGGAGKSGGQRQKLATTCLAAALRYQLGGEDQALPQYAPVVLDEAFDKADNEFTAQAMTIFTKFGFQMIVATPLKSVMTLEPFIGGACFVDIAERRRSSVLMIEYDEGQRRLRLPERLHAETGFAVS